MIKRALTGFILGGCLVGGLGFMVGYKARKPYMSVIVESKYPYWATNEYITITNHT